MSVKTKGNLSQTLLLALTDVEMHEFGVLIFGQILNVSVFRDAAGEATTYPQFRAEAPVMHRISVQDHSPPYFLLLKAKEALCLSPG